MARIHDSEVRQPGIEPGSPRWQREIITTRPLALSSWSRSSHLAVFFSSVVKLCMLDSTCKIQFQKLQKYH
jgi:hypothetical protein